MAVDTLRLSTYRRPRSSVRKLAQARTRCDHPFRARLRRRWSSTEHEMCESTSEGCGTDKRDQSRRPRKASSYAQSMYALCHSLRYEETFAFFCRSRLIGRVAPCSPSAYVHDKSPVCRLFVLEAVRHTGSGGLSSRGQLAAPRFHPPRSILGCILIGTDCGPRRLSRSWVRASSSVGTQLQRTGTSMSPSTASVISLMARSTTRLARIVAQREASGILVRPYLVPTTRR